MRKYGEGGRIVTRAGANYQHKGFDARGVKTFWRAARIYGNGLHMRCIGAVYRLHTVGSRLPIFIGLSS